MPGQMRDDIAITRVVTGAAQYQPSPGIRKALAGRIKYRATSTRHQFVTVNTDILNRDAIQFAHIFWRVCKACQFGHAADYTDPLPTP